ncbi:MAG: hypothetical protein WED83_07670 [Acidimicrobiia bacterium]
MTEQGPVVGLRIEELATIDLMRLHRASLYELHRRGIVRTLNAPQGDWAELLVATAYNGRLASNSEKSFDIVADDGRRLQVKARVIDHRHVGSHITSPFRSWDFDAAVVVLLDPVDLSVGRASELPVAIVQVTATYRSHVNGYVLRPTPALMSLGIEVSDRLRTAALQL